jgi:hypothetical protein
MPTKTTSTPTTDDLLAQAAEAERQAAEIRAEAQRAAEEREQRREAALLTWRAQQLDAHDDADLLARVVDTPLRRGTRRRLPDPAGPGRLRRDLCIARGRRASRHNEAWSHSVALGREFNEPRPPGPLPKLMDLADAGIERYIGQQLADDAAARQDELEAQLQTP